MIDGAQCPAYLFSQAELRLALGLPSSECLLMGPHHAKVQEIQGRQAAVSELPERLPSYRLMAEWWPWTDEHEEAARRGSPILAEIKAAFRQACEKPGWNPRTVQMGGNVLAVNFCAHSWAADRGGWFAPGKPRSGPRSGELHSVQSVHYEDHPFLAVLNSLPHVPKAVKHLYRKEVRLAVFRSDEAFPWIEAENAADAAWQKWRANTSGVRNVEHSSPLLLAH